MPFNAFLSGLGLGAGFIVAIGAQNAYVLKQGLRRQHVLLIVAFCALCDMVLIAAGIAGMGAVIQAHPVLLTAVRYFGAAFLCAYAVRAWLSAWRGGSHLDAASAPAQSVGKTLATVAALSLLNPHVYLDTVVLLGAIGGRLAWPARAWFGAGAMVASVLWFSILGFGARVLDRLFARDIAWRILDGIIGVVMLCIALSLLLS
jgi:L-lysine exporter family protein LysE/ArgO